MLQLLLGFQNLRSFLSHSCLQISTDKLLTLKVADNQKRIYIIESNSTYFCWLNGSVALLPAGEYRVGDYNLEDGLADARQVARDEDHHDRGQGRGVVWLAPAIIIS